MPPQGGGGKGKTIGIVVGALVVVGAIIGGLFMFGVIGGTSYKLTTPDTVAGEYKIEPGSDRTFDGKKGLTGKSEDKIPGMTAEKGVSANYSAGAADKLNFGGAYGEVDDPDKALDYAFDKTTKSLASMAKSDGGAKEMSPSGFDGETMKCQAFSAPTGSMKITYCVWADSSTLGQVAIQGNGSLDDAAETTAKVFEDARSEK
ncbi:hypothetical protein [Streptomyces sp. 3N207]|uniref:hypothetical protein n=1 Tax=Streptomyces sp. 3N207 TaxID=3457417 RepID=UPI003FD51F42